MVTALPRTVPRALVVLATAAVVPTGLLAQQAPGCTTPFDLPIQVTSSQDGEPVVGASVVIPSLQERLLTDEAGRILATGVCPGPLELSISHLGFGTTTITREAQRSSLLSIGLDPQAVPVEGLTVSVETVIRKLERRRKAFAFKSFAFDAGDFSDESLPTDIPAYVAARAGHPLTSCGPDTPFGDRNCYPFRGRMRSLQAICLDEARLRGGPSELDRMVQHADIARLEFYPSAGIMKVYTRAFIALAAEKPWLLELSPESC